MRITFWSEILKEREYLGEIVIEVTILHEFKETGNEVVCLIQLA
jgi:hypothetical protein